MNLAKEITLRITFKGIFPEIAVYLQRDFVGYVGDMNTVVNIANSLGIDIGNVEKFLTDEAEFIREDYHRLIFHGRKMPRSYYLERQLTETI